MKFYSEYDAWVSYPALVGGGLFYLFSVFGLKAITASSPIYKVKQFSIAYNIAQVVLCAYMTYGFFVYGFSFTNPFGFNNQFTAEIEWFIFVHYLSKFLDFFDTYIMVLKKSWRQFTFLHVFHHASIGVIWGFLLLVGQGNGVAYFGAFINSFVHLLMYSHYLFTSLGYENPYKFFITYIQMFQFGLCILQAVLSLFIEKVFDIKLAWLQVGYHIIMLYLFNDFLTNAKKAKKSGDGQAAKTEKKQSKKME